MTTFSDYVWDSIFDTIGRFQNIYIFYDGINWTWEDYYKVKVLFSSKTLDGLLPVSDVAVLKTSYQFESLYFHADDRDVKTMTLFYHKQNPTYYTNYTAKTVFSYIVTEAL